MFAVPQDTSQRPVPLEDESISTEMIWRGDVNVTESAPDPKLRGPVVTVLPSDNVTVTGGSSYQSKLKAP